MLEHPFLSFCFYFWLDNCDELCYNRQSIIKYASKEYQKYENSNSKCEDIL